MLIDSNVLIYALNTDSPKHEASRLFVRANINEAYVAHQNILEATRVMSHRAFPKQLAIKTVVQAIKQITNSMRVIYPNEDTLEVYLELLKKYGGEGNRVFDVYLTATALSNGVMEIATDNVKHFMDYEEIRVINPYK